MSGIESPGAVTLENQITERFGLLLSQTQLAELLGRKIGRRVYYPAAEVARIILGTTTE